MFHIDLAANGELLLHMPNRCALEIPATPTGVEYIKKVIYDHKRSYQPPKASGYIGSLPTKHAADKFLREKADRIKMEKAEQAKANASKLGIDLDKLEISI